MNQNGTFDLGDIDTDGDIDSDDWAILRANQHTDLSSLTLAEAYLLGDMDGDFLNNHADFVLFKSAFDVANGPSSFAAMLTSVPEPDTIILLLVAAILGTPMWGRRRLAILARISS